MLGAGRYSRLVLLDSSPITGQWWEMGPRLRLSSSNTWTLPCWLRALSNTVRNGVSCGRQGESDVVLALEELLAVWGWWQGLSQLCWEAGQIDWQLGKEVIRGGPAVWQGF